MVSKHSPTKQVNLFLRTASYLSKFSKKTRLRLIDHTFIVIGGLYLFLVTYLAWLKALGTGNPYAVTVIAPISFLATVGVILIAMVACEFVIRRLIR